MKRLYMLSVLVYWMIAMSPCFISLNICTVHAEEADEYPSDSEDDDVVESPSAGSDNSFQEKKKNKTRDVIKENAKGALNIVVEEAIKAVGDSVAKGISESVRNPNNSNNDRNSILFSSPPNQNENQSQDSPRRTRKRITDY